MITTPLTASPIAASARPQPQAPTLTEALATLTPGAAAELRDSGLQLVAADCRGKTLPGFRCVPGTNFQGQVGHFWTV